MYRTLRLKDLTDIGTKIDVCTVANMYIVTAYTNGLEGDINGYLRIDNCENDTLGGTVLFSLRNGEQICLTELSYEEQLIIPEAYLAHIKEALSFELEVFGQRKSAWKNLIEKINRLHENDSNNNFEVIPLDLQVPDLKYLHTETTEESNSSTEQSSIQKQTIFSRFLSIFKRKQDN